MPWRGSSAFSLGIKVIVLDPNNQVLLETLTYETGWHLPGGGVEPGETVWDAAYRELQEETGWVPETPLHLWTILYHPQEGRDDHVVVFAVKTLERPVVESDQGEVETLSWFPLDDLPAGLTAGNRRLLQAWSAGEIPTGRW